MYNTVPESEIRSKAEEKACAIDEDCAVKLDEQLFPLYFKMVAPRVSRFLTAGQGEQRLWERD